MYSFLRIVVTGIGNLGRRRPSSAAARQARPAVEAMEDRLVPSGTPLLLKTLHHRPHHPKHVHLSPALLRLLEQESNLQVNPIVHVPPIILQLPVPDYTNVFFTMTSLDNGTPHQLLIQTQTANADGSASFTGVWGLQNNGGVPITNGQLVENLFDTHITFSWANGTHSFDGTITQVNGHWHIDGQVTVQGGGGPGHVVGDQDIVPDLTGVNFAMTSLDNGTPHQLLIQSETINAAGDASFTGLWGQQNNGGMPISGGHLGFDATGVEVTFNWANGTHSFDGHVSWGTWLTFEGSVALSPISILPRPGFGWLIDGQVTVQGGGGPGHVSGHQV
jgi:hypothetical protein